MNDKKKTIKKEKGFVSIKDVDQLEKVTNFIIPDNDRSDLQKVIEKYPVRLSKHVISQMQVSKNVAYQYMPFVEELDSNGLTNTWVGLFQNGLLEQMYPNRVIFLINMTCPVYCRFCFRKHKDSRNKKNPTIENIKIAVKHVKNSPLIKEILVTGGDPFLKKDNLTATIDGLMKIDHVKTLRLATRSIAYFPELFLKNDCSYLKYIEQKNHELQQVNKRMEIATHFIHPDEISRKSLDIITSLVKSGIAVYVQTPFLNKCNDKGPELVKLFNILRGAGAELHYIFVPCSPIHGNSPYWTPLAKGIDIAKHLRANLSDRAIPKICTATPIGKIDWHSSGWAVEKVKGKEDFIWIRTPYTPEFFKEFAPLADELDNIRLNEEGTFDIQYMTKIGDKSHFLGSRTIKNTKQNFFIKKEKINSLKLKFLNRKEQFQSIVDTYMDNLKRLHKAIVEISDTASDNEIEYINSDKQITDVIIYISSGLKESLQQISIIINKLQNFNHVNAVRLRNTKFNSSPELFTNSIIKKIGSLNKLSTANPLRLEIETWFITADEIKESHGKVVRKLNNNGIIVYNNTPLFGGINDSADIIHALAHSLRKTGIEFHHLYVAGLPIQRDWNTNYPVESYNIIDIASKVRREGSGREIPGYIILTPLGEVDYGLTSSFVKDDNDELKIKLDCYDMSYFINIDQNISFSKAVKFDNGKPVFRIPGLIKSDNFPI